MADNVTLSAGTADGATLAADDIGGIHYQRIKVTFGADGASTDASSSNPLPVAVDIAKAEDAAAASGDTGIALLTVRQDTIASSTSADGDYTHAKSDSAGRLYVNASGVAVPVTDNSGSLTVDNGGTFAVQAAQSGTWNITNISGTVSLPTGAATAAKQPALGTAGTASTDVITVQGIASMTPVQVSDGGGSLTVDGTVTANLGTVGTTASDLAKAEDAASASGDVGVAMLTVRQDTIASSTSADGDYQSAKTNSVGALYTSLSHLGANAVSTGNGTAGTGVQRVAICSDNTAFSVNATLQASTNTQEVVGDAAHDAAIAGNPVRIAGRAMSADYTAVASGDTADLLASLLGKQINLPYALPAATWNYAAASGGITNTTGVTAKTAAGASVRNYITHVDVVNGHATVSTDVQIRDGAAGTVLWRGFAQAAGGGVSADFNPPLRGTANTLVEVACGTSGSATYFNLTGFTAAE